MAVVRGLGAVLEGCVAVSVRGDFKTDSGVFVAVFLASVVLVVCESVASVCGVAKVTALIFFPTVELLFFNVFVVEEAVAGEVVAGAEVVGLTRVFAASFCDVPPVF